MRALIAILIFIAAANLILYHFFPSPPKPETGRLYDAAIVLGCPAKTDGTLSRMQKTRMDAAIRLYKRNAVRAILISGGSVHNEYTEADIMAAYAQTCGIPDHALIRERHANNTFENLNYAKKLCDSRGWHRVIVVTSCFHTRRASYMVRKFFDEYAMQKTAEKEKWKHYLSEYFRMWNSLRCEVKLRRKNRN